MIAPCPYDRNHGGVQKSAQIAWEGIASSPLIEHAQLLCYGASCDAASGGSIRFCSKSKLGAIQSAFALNRPADLILFWHAGMLKLLPFLRPGRARVVLFVHGIESWKPLGTVFGGSLARVETLLCGTRFSLAKCVQANPVWGRTPARIVPLGLGVEDVSPVPPDGPPAALIISRMMRSEDYKGHRQLIEAWPRVVERMPQAELWIAGTGDLEPELASLASSRSGKSIRFYGSVSEEMKLNLLRRCRCFVMPSAYEGFGLVYLEAMRLGRPSLVHAIGAGREVIDPPQMGLAVNPDNSEEMVGALMRLLQGGPEWDCWSIRSRERYGACFTARKFQDRVIEACLNGIGAWG